MISKLKIPDERLAVLIGKRGGIKKTVENRTNTVIQVGEEVTIEGEATDVMTAENIIRAIGRGFAPLVSMKLRDEDMTLVVIPLPKERNTLVRVKARVIGSRGKARRNIERLSKTDICVYGKTVSIIGTYESVKAARSALEMLIKGSEHKNVYKFLGETHGRSP
ncbi:MAG: RNA-processing protein [Candidatus Aenigmarchaeota archaeon]|nr:RNA-processing protein [Candidatus Aenigmarchaeota archaeon]